jgi:exopolysaccharide biosynthesis polyprenyl glycosylphosphotransferase
MALELDSTAFGRVGARTLTLPGAPVGLVLGAYDAAALSLGLAVVTRSPISLLVVPVLLVALGFLGCYRPNLSPTLATDAGRLVAGIGVPLAIMAAIVGGPHAISLLRGGVAGGGALLGGRLLCYGIVKRARARGEVFERTLIVGAGKVGVQVARTLQEHPEYGLVPVGFLDSFHDTDLWLPVLGDASQLDEILTDYGIHRVIVAFGATREPDMVKILRACDRASVDIHVLPRFFELGVAPAGPDTDHLWGMPVVRMRRAAFRSSAWRTKRVIDAVSAAIALVVVSPVLATLAVVVKLSSRGPVFFRQKRVGQHGDVVEVLKFRSMRINEASDTEWVRNDDKVTWIGRIMRKTSLDELPQLINVLKGDMSLVGPRPERPHFADQFTTDIPGYGDRHRVPVGITGWAQVHGLRGDTSIEERARFDNEYIEHWSPWRDIVILARTAGEVVRGSGR